MANLWHTCDTLTLCKPPDYAWKAGFGVNTTSCGVTCDDTGDWSDQFIWLVTSDWRSFTTSPSQSSTIWTLWVPKDDLYLWRKVPFPKKVTKNAWRSLMEKEKTDHHDGHHCALKTETRRQTFVYYWTLQQWWVRRCRRTQDSSRKGILFRHNKAIQSMKTLAERPWKSI